MHRTLRKEAQALFDELAASWRQAAAESTYMHEDTYSIVSDLAQEARDKGYTFASGKPIIGIDASERRFRNLFVEGMITEKVHDISAIIPTIKKVFSK